MKSRVEEFREYVPLVRTLFNPGMRDRHWLQVSDVVGFNLYPDDDMCLSQLIAMNLQTYVAQFEAISETASKEFSLEKALTKMKDEWEPVKLQVHIFEKKYDASNTINLRIISCEVVFTLSYRLRFLRAVIRSTHVAVLCRPTVYFLCYTFFIVIGLHWASNLLAQCRPSK